MLGAQVQGDQPSLTLKKRLDLALSYLNDHPQAKVIVSGAQGADEAYTEAYVMAKYLIEQGVDESRVIQEEQAHDTRENLEYSRVLAEQHGMDTASVLIITSDFHLCRAKYLARKLGMEPYGLGQPDVAGNFEGQLPSAGGVRLCEGSYVICFCRPWRQAPRSELKNAAPAGTAESFDISLLGD